MFSLLNKVWVLFLNRVCFPLLRVASALHRRVWLPLLRKWGYLPVEQKLWVAVCLLLLCLLAALLWVWRLVV
jgi:hypothetical protein